MISENHIKTLNLIYKLLKDADVSWKLIGSTNLALQGVEVTAKDIDLTTNAKDVYKIDTAFSKYSIEPAHRKETENFRSIYGLYKMSDIQVELMADLETNNDGKWTKTSTAPISPVSIDVSGTSIPCASLDEEYNAYLKLGRIEKANLIKRIIDLKQ